MGRDCQSFGDLIEKYHPSSFRLEVVLKWASKDDWGAQVGFYGREMSLRYISPQTRCPRTPRMEPGNKLRAGVYVIRLKRPIPVNTLIAAFCNFRVIKRKTWIQEEILFYLKTSIVSPKGYKLALIFSL